MCNYKRWKGQCIFDAFRTLTWLMISIISSIDALILTPRCVIDVMFTVEGNRHRVLILDETVSNSNSSKTLWKCINSTVLSPAMSKFSADWAI